MQPSTAQREAEEGGGGAAAGAAGPATARSAAGSGPRCEPARHGAQAVGVGMLGRVDWAVQQTALQLAAAACPAACRAPPFVHCRRMAQHVLPLLRYPLPCRPRSTRPPAARAGAGGSGGAAGLQPLQQKLQQHIDREDRRIKELTEGELPWGVAGGIVFYLERWRDELLMLPGAPLRAGAARGLPLPARRAAGLQALKPRPQLTLLPPAPLSPLTSLAPHFQASFTTSSRLRCARCCPPGRTPRAGSPPRRRAAWPARR